MNELPRVLQNEIWEYVRGDRAFWKSQYELVVDQWEHMIQSVDNAPIKFHWPANTRTGALMQYIKDRACLIPFEGRRIRRFRRYLSSVNIQLYVDDEEDMSDVHWRHWCDWVFHVENVTQ
jgi:hypothetical protein